MKKFLKLEAKFLAAKRTKRDKMAGKIRRPGNRIFLIVSLRKTTTTTRQVPRPWEVTILLWREGGREEDGEREGVEGRSRVGKRKGGMGEGRERGSVGKKER